MGVIPWLLPRIQAKSGYYYIYDSTLHASAEGFALKCFISIGSQGGEVVSSLNFEIPCTYCPVVFITFSVAPPFADTSGVISYSLHA